MRVVGQAVLLGALASAMACGTFVWMCGTRTTRVDVDVDLSIRDKYMGNSQFLVGAPHTAFYLAPLK